MKTTLLLVLLAASALAQTADIERELPTDVGPVAIVLICPEGMEYDTKSLGCVPVPEPIAFTLTEPPEDTDTPTLAPDLPNVSVRLRAGEAAPFDGRLLSLEENLRRGKSAVACKAELASAKDNVWSSKGVLVSVIIGALVLGAAAGAGVAVWALKK